MCRIKRRLLCPVGFALADVYLHSVALSPAPPCTVDSALVFLSFDRGDEAEIDRRVESFARVESRGFK